MSEFERALKIVRELQHYGYEALFVGGCVRDSKSGTAPADIDVATSATLEEIQRIFPECKEGVGSIFKVNLVDGIEVATFRQDTYNFEGAVSVYDAKNFFDDSCRRDITINAMGYDPITNEEFDYHGGKADLELGLIRFVGIAAARITEHPIRMLRACRFAAKIDGRLVPSAFLGIKDYAHLAKDIKPEAIQIEIMKAMKLPNAGKFFELLHRTGLLNYLIPEMDDCWYHDGGNHHSEYVHDHLLICGDNISADRPLVKLAGYLHDIGKVEAYDENAFTFIGHEKFGTDVARDILLRLKFSTEDIEKVCSLILTHMRCIETSSTQKSYRRTLVKLAKHNVSVEDFVALKVADRVANTRKENFTNGEVNCFLANFKAATETENAAFSTKDLAVNGRDVMDVGTPQGPLVGLVLEHIFGHVVDNPELNVRETLLEWLNDNEYWCAWHNDPEGFQLTL